mmetsp:Transcript_40512/g.94067  ORF Transcript_40512/g.94067 Transcript_40512/m.94067 type:complete len:337 (-) Transcript_40512:40-1050(-)
MVKALYVYLVRHAESKNNSRDLHDMRSAATSVNLPTTPSASTTARMLLGRGGDLMTDNLKIDEEDEKAGMQQAEQLATESMSAMSSPRPGREPDPGLTGRGKSQAEAVAGLLRKIRDDPKTEPRLRPGFLYTSGFLRALETCHPIAESLELAPELHSDLHEEGGVFEGPRRGIRRESYPLHHGLNAEQMREVLPTLQVVDSIPEEGWWVGGQEPAPAANERAQRCAEWLWKLAEERGSEEDRSSESRGAVVCVTHGLFMDRLLKALAGLDPHLGSVLFMSFNCAYWLVQLRLNHDDNTPRIAVMAASNVVDHVPMSLRTGHSICGIAHCQPSYATN